MRLWSVHPRYFDRQALTACWREALLAQAVLAGRTRGYLRHPQLERLRAHSAPVFESLPVTTDQLSYEWLHLRAKLQLRSPAVAVAWQWVTQPEAHPLFTVVPGPIASWERPKR